MADVCVAILRTEAGRDPHHKGLHDLTIYAAEPGWPSDKRLRLLASWAAFQEAEPSVHTLAEAD
jgi:hypothetical protein